MSTRTQSRKVDLKRRLSAKQFSPCFTERRANGTRDSGVIFALRQSLLYQGFVNSRSSVHSTGKSALQQNLRTYVHHAWARQTFEYLEDFVSVAAQVHSLTSLHLRTAPSACATPERRAVLYETALSHFTRTNAIERKIWQIYDRMAQKPPNIPPNIR